jgi:CdiI immunity protein
MTHDAQKTNAFDAENFPALQEFLTAYLHEDFGEEYGTAPQAFAALVADASGDQIRNVREEWQALRQAFSGRPMNELQHGLGQLGAAWQPQSEQELQAVDEILSRAEA